VGDGSESVRASSPTLAPRRARLRASSTSSALSIDVAGIHAFRMSERGFSTRVLLGLPSVKKRVAAWLSARMISEVPPAAAFAVVFLLSLAGPVRAGGCVAGNTPSLGQARPDLARLFTPLTAPAGVYAVSTTTEAVGALASALKACDTTPVEGAWAPTRQEAHEAFGQAGIYDRARLAQLFGGRRLTVIRGSLARASELDAYTLISPYPNAALDRIEPGTMVIVVRVTR
jgi:hypothetical protein